MKKYIDKVNEDYSPKTKAGIVICDLIISVLLTTAICVIAFLLKDSITDLGSLLNVALEFIKRYYGLLILFCGLFFILIRTRIAVKFFVETHKNRNKGGK